MRHRRLGDKYYTQLFYDTRELKRKNDAEFDQSFYAALLTVSTILYFTDQYTTVPGKHQSFSMFRLRWYDVEMLMLSHWSSFNPYPADQDNSRF